MSARCGLQQNTVTCSELGMWGLGMLGLLIVAPETSKTHVPGFRPLLSLSSGFQTFHAAGTHGTKLWMEGCTRPLCLLLWERPSVWYAA